MALNVRITSGSRQQSLEVTLPSVEDTVRYLSHELPAQIMQIPEEDFLSSLSIDKQVAMLAERAYMFALRSEYLNATALREARFLLRQ